MSKLEPKPKPSPIKQKPVSMTKWIGVALGASLVMLVLSAVTFSLFVQTATQAAVELAGSAGTALVSTLGTAALQGIELTLRQGSDADRLKILNELGKAELNKDAQLPPSLVSAIKSNLEHDNEAVRECSRRIMEAIQPAVIAGELP